MVKVERIDNEDDFTTLFKIEVKSNNHQEIRVPIFIADLIETNIKTMNFNTEKLRKDKKSVLD